MCFEHDPACSVCGHEHYPWCVPSKPKPKKKCTKCKQPFDPEKPYYRQCNSCFTLPRFGCQTCGKEAKVTRTGEGTVRVECCGKVERFGNGRQKPMSKAVKDFLGPDLGDFIDATIGDDNGYFE